MPVIDVDAHVQEPFDWLDKHDPKLAARLPTFNVIEYIANVVAGEFISQIPADSRPKPFDVMPEPFLNFMERLPEGNAPYSVVEEIFDQMAIECPEDVSYQAFRIKGAWKPEERIPINDEFGIDKQFINPTKALGWADLARDIAKDRQLELDVIKAYNRWIYDITTGYQDRLLPVFLMVLDDVPEAIRQIKEAHRLGIRAINIPAQPVAGKSLAHPDFEPIWALCEDTGIAIIFHVAHSGPTVLADGWGNAGGNLLASMMTYRSQHEQVPTAALTAMVFGGIFERYPKLVVMSQELGVDWLPYWLTKLDSALEKNAFSKAAPYTLPMKPSEYVQRNIFVSGLATPLMALQPTFDNVPHGILTFCSDYPHPEGGKIEDAKKTFAAQLEGYSDEVKADFYGNAVARAMNL